MAITPLRLLMPMILGCLIVPSAFAESGRVDYDLDDDGLIEINSLADLDEIRNNLDGTSLYGDSTGCPVDGCIGFELTTTLDFDTNADGVMDTNDAYWNEGNGWEPIGNSSSLVFQAIFNGNGYQIRNLYINRSNTNYVGLFGYIYGESALLRNIGLTGDMMRVVGNNYVGGLAGYVNSAASIDQSYVTGAVTGDWYVGGFAGYLSNSAINNSFASGAVTGDYVVGGLGGHISDSAINSSFATGAVTGNSYMGGLVGANSYSVITNSYWSVDTTGISSTSTSAASLAELQCPVSGNDTSCVTDQTLYAEWDSGVWDFGTNVQLPGLILSGTTYRDSDGDGSLDGDDVYPNNRAASWDGDNDGYADAWTIGCDATCIANSGLTLDHFPATAAAWQDTDLDGYPDAWATGCDATCIANSGLTLDQFPTIAAAWQDTDLDGYPDARALDCDATCIENSGLTLDQFPSNPAAWQDEDLDGYPESWVDGCDTNCQAATGLTLDSYLNDTDNDGINNSDDTDDNNDGIMDADADSDGLIDISSLEQLNAIRYNLAGTGRTLVDGGDSDSSGCPVAVVNGVHQFQCMGYELINNLDFDTSADGVMDANDEYWNGGKGWEPVGTDYDTAFTSIFDGNGYQIRNLFINRSSTDYVGLFGYILGESAQLRNIGLTGKLMKLQGYSSVGGLVGYAKNAAMIEQSYVTGVVTGYLSVGGLAGYLSSSVINNSYVTGAVTGSSYVGGLAGRNYSNSAINKSFASGAVTGNSSVGGLAGYSSSSVITHSYWAVDTTGISSTSASAVSLAELQCPAGADNSSCVADQTLYAEWDSGVWDFGTNTQLPGLILSGTTYRDSDGDGSLDGDDAFPNNHAASWDGDNDGHPDMWTIGCDANCISNSGLTLDQFQSNPAVWQDTDLDGYPDAWAAGCDATCIANSGLTLDQFPTTAAAWQDTDLDGYPDAWALDCDATCIENSGLILDQFPAIAGAGPDTDLDGNPDVWATGCDANCQAATGLTLDSYLDDTDNDGINNSDDTDDNNDGITDADADSDGLIDISSLEQLNAIRYNLMGTGRTLVDGGDSDSSGCPATVIDGVMQLLCTGYELTTNLDFDTNADGVMDEYDAYWNGGEGWMPIGSSSTPFTSTFDGNGHQIRNLYINRSNTDYIGLFGYISGESAQLRNIGLTGELMQVLGDDNVGGLVGYAKSAARIEQSYVTGVVTGDWYVGGLAGFLDGSAINNSFASGAVTGSSYVGGLAGRSYISAINNSFASGAVSGNSSVGGLNGYSSSFVITNSHWAVDTTGISSTSLSAATLSELQCPAGADNTSCASGKTLYAEWDSGVWDFGSNTQLPGLILSGTTYRDSDGDGSLDGDDVYPNNRAASWDGDHDGYADAWTIGCDATCIANSGLTLDHFPATAAAWQDTDLDGYPDAWAAGCDATCIANSGLTLDQFPTTAAAWQDTDLDGYPDAWAADCDTTCIANSGLTLDYFPATAAAWQDTDLDGYPDAWATGCDANCQIATALTLDSYPNDTDNDGINNSDDTDDNNDGIMDTDADSDGLIDISSLEQLNAIRYNLAGTGRTLVDGGDSDSSGCPVAVVNGVPQFQCMGYELINNLDFDTNADGVMDANDAYWNEGDGWEPLGSYDFPFGSLFDGNGHEIRNLYVNRPYEDGVGLFGAISGEAVIVSNLGLVGKLSNVLGADGVGLLAGFVGVSAEVSNSYAKGVVTGSYFVGGLVGLLTENASISSSHAAVLVSGDDYVGGLAGYLDEGSISHSFAIEDVSGDEGIGGLVGVAGEIASISDTFATGAVSGSYYVGGLVGELGESALNNSFATGSVTATGSYGGGLVGYGDPDTIITNSHWAADTTGQLNSDGESEFDNYFGATLAELQCPTSSENKDDCVISNTLYAGWDSSVWDFGTSTQLPGLIINGIVYRDEDGNGSLDENQAPTVTLTLKQDGYVVSDITAGDGDVTLEATVTDPDASDRHTLSWTYEGITVTSETDTGVTFKSDNLVAGEYTVSVVATDNRYSPLSAEAEITFTVYSAYVPEPAPAPGNTSTSSGKKGGGGALGLIWLMLCGGLVYTRQRRVVFAG